MVNTIWVKPSGVEVNVDSGSYEAAASLGWKPKDQPVVEEKKRGRPAKSQEA
jgi:hypothetical protein